MGKKWTEEEIEYLCDSYGNRSVSAIAKHLNRTVEAVMVKKNRLQLGAFLSNGDKYVTKNYLFSSLGVERGGYKNISWIQNRGLPTHKIRRRNATFEVIYIEEFWQWAKVNQSFLNFANFEPYSLGPEPDWVDQKRRRDFKQNLKIYGRKWTMQDDDRLKHYISEHKYTYIQLSQMLNRTVGAILRRLNDLNIQERPIRGNPNNKWTDKEWELLSDMIKQGYSYESMSDVLGRSSKAIRSRVFDMYLTENLDKVRRYIGKGNWGDNRPNIPLRYMRVMSSDEKEIVKRQLTVLAFDITQISQHCNGG